MSILFDLLAAILKVLLPILFDRASRPPVSEDATPDARRDALRERVKATWGRAATVVLICLCLGCSAQVRTIYIPDGQPVRLRQRIVNAQIWALDKDGTPTPGTMDLPEGWYALPMPDAPR